MAAAVLESPGAYSESLGDQDDVIYPCKGCGEILEEGKAFELAGNRWHIDCFRCNTCSTLLDSDANLLLLGDGSLICNNCTYSCNACGNKIEDLAILTGDQAFCASCFRCRNCKRKIENLRYARTSQGIFCMSCHESLMARRRKKSKGTSRQAQSGASGSHEKALPSLPPGVEPSAAFSPEIETPPSSYPEIKSPSNLSATASPQPDDARKDLQTLPSSTYADSRPSNVSDETEDPESGFLPMAFDPNPARPPPAAVQRKQVPRQQESPSIPAQSENPAPSRDHLGKTSASKRDNVRDIRDAVRDDSTTRSASADGQERSAPTNASPATKQGESFKLQEPPRSLKAMSPKVDTNAKDERSSTGASPASLGSQHSGVNPFDDPKRNSSKYADRAVPPRGESLAQKSSPTAETGLIAPPTHERKHSTASVTEDPRLSMEAPPPRSASRPSAPSKSVANGDFIAPRAPPQPPFGHKQHESISTLHSHDGDVQPSPRPRNSGLPRHNVDGPFSMEEEMARILRGDNHRHHASQGSESSSGGGVLRRVSNAVKHGRSFSDRVGSAGTKSPHNGSQIEISSPITAVGGDPSITSPTSQTALDQLRSQLKRAHQRIAELESDKNGLQEKFENDAQISAASKELSDKRNTMVVLDAQREIVIAELESVTKHLKKAKDSNKPLDVNMLKSDISKDFSDALQRVKDAHTADIEKLIAQRNSLGEEIQSLIQMKDKGFSEYEVVSSKNAQLLDLNAQLVHNIQDMYKAGAQVKSKDSSSTNGLGIYGARSVETPGAQTDHAEPAAMVSAPTVVDIRKAQAKKFNWRNRGEKLAKAATRGIKGMVQGETPTRDGTSPLGGEIGLPYHMTQNTAGGEQPRQDGKGGAAFGFFNQKPNNAGLRAASGTMGAMKDNSSTNLGPSDPSVLFGSELEARCEFEKRVVPNIVSRCIEEVELRGMDGEGIYRKSGGSSLVKTIQQGFEKDGTYDISDDDLDIHAVTSALKQYFRKLPTPLITYDVYDSLLEAGQVQDKEKQIAAIKASIADLPDAHRNCLEYLFQHLARVVQHESSNLMTPLNLSVVFAPTIMRPLSIEKEMSDMLPQRQAVQAILEHHEMIFAD